MTRPPPLTSSTYGRGAVTARCRPASQTLGDHEPNQQTTVAGRRHAPLARNPSTAPRVVLVGASMGRVATLRYGGREPRSRLLAVACRRVVCPCGMELAPQEPVRALLAAKAAMDPPHLPPVGRRMMTSRLVGVARSRPKIGRTATGDGHAPVRRRMTRRRNRTSRAGACTTYMNTTPGTPTTTTPKTKNTKEHTSSTSPRSTAAHSVGSNARAAQADHVRGQLGHAFEAARCRPISNRGSVGARSPNPSSAPFLTRVAASFRAAGSPLGADGLHSPSATPASASGAGRQKTVDNHHLAPPWAARRVRPPASPPRLRAKTSQSLHTKTGKNPPLARQQPAMCSANTASVRPRGLPARGRDARTMRRRVDAADAEVEDMLPASRAWAFKKVGAPSEFARVESQSSRALCKNLPTPLGSSSSSTYETALKTETSAGHITKTKPDAAARNPGRWTAGTPNVYSNSFPRRVISRVFRPQLSGVAPAAPPNGPFDADNRLVATHGLQIISGDDQPSRPGPERAVRCARREQPSLPAELRQGADPQNHARLTVLRSNDRFGGESRRLFHRHAQRGHSKRDGVRRPHLAALHVNRWQARCCTECLAHLRRYRRPDTDHDRTDDR